MRSKLSTEFLPVMGALQLEIELYVPGRPSQWSRGTPIPGQHSSFTLKRGKDRVAQDVIRECFKDWLRLHPEHRHLFPWQGPVRARVHSLYRIPKGKMRRWDFTWREKTDAPDVSNLLKQPEDSFIAKNNYDPDIPTPYVDDSQIVQVYASKHYHPHYEGVIIALELFTAEEYKVRWDSLHSKPPEEDNVMDFLNSTLLGDFL